MAKRKKDETARTLGIKVVDLNDEKEKDFFYKMTATFYRDVPGMTHKRKVAFVRKQLGEYADAHLTIMHGIHAWKNSGIDYPYALPIVFMVHTANVSLDQKEELVQLFHEGMNTYEELMHWCVTGERLKKGNEDATTT